MVSYRNYCADNLTLRKQMREEILPKLSLITKQLHHLQTSSIQNLPALPILRKKVKRGYQIVINSV